MEGGKIIGLISIWTFGPGELRKRLKERFDEEDIENPWPHTKLYFGNTPVEKNN